MTVGIDRAQQKRRLILSPFLCVFMGFLSYATAPSVLAFGIGLAAGVLLSPVVAWLIDRSEQGRTASAWVGGAGAAVGVVVLRALIPDEGGEPIYFVLFTFGLALMVGMGISSLRRLRTRS